MYKKRGFTVKARVLKKVQDPFNVKLLSHNEMLQLTTWKKRIDSESL